jgi:hypothetical protein
MHRPRITLGGQPGFDLADTAADNFAYGDKASPASDRCSQIGHGLAQLEEGSRANCDGDEARPLKSGGRRDELIRELLSLLPATGGTNPLLASTNGSVVCTAVTDAAGMLVVPELLELARSGLPSIGFELVTDADS